MLCHIFTSNVPYPPSGPSFHIRILVMSLGLIAFILSAVVSGGCAFVVPTAPSQQCNDNGEYGLNKFKPVNCKNNIAIAASCTDYTTSMDELLDEKVTAARALGNLATIFGGLLWAGSLFMLGFKFPGGMFKSIGAMYIFCFITQMLTFLILGTSACAGAQADVIKLADPDYKCKLGSDAITAIFAAIFYLGIGLTVLISPVPTTAVINCCNGCNQENCCGEGATKGAVVVPECTLPSDKLAQQPGNSIVEKTENIDGTTTIKTTTFNPDGSQSVSIITKQSDSVAMASV